MKKLSALIVLVLSISLTACGSSEVSLEDSDEISETEVLSNETKNETVFSEYVLEDFNTDPVIQETVLWDDHNVVVAATALNYTGWSAQLELTFENYSDTDLNFTAATASYSWNSVNGYMIPDGYLNLNVLVGESVDDTISFDMYELQSYGINEVADIQIGIKAKDDDQNEFYMYPLTIETSVAGGYDYSKDVFQEALTGGMFETIGGYQNDYCSTDGYFNANGITLDALAIFSDDEDDDYLMVVEFSNSSDVPANVNISNIRYNDLIAYEQAWTGDSIAPDKSMVLTADIGKLIDRFNEENSLDEPFEYDGIETITFTVNILGEDYADLISPEEVTIQLR